jgi:uncharacterized protein
VVSSAAAHHRVQDRQQFPHARDGETMRVLGSVLLFLMSGPLRAQEVSPIIDMHLHAHTLSMYGTPPPAVCTNDQEILFPGIDPGEPMTFARVRSCGAPVRAPKTDKELRRAMLEMLERYNIRAVATGRLDEVTRWRAAAPDRIIPAIPFDDYEKREPETLRSLFTEGKFAVFAEISSQYNGLSPADPPWNPISHWLKS